jgi:hypothetical protein
VRPNVEVLGDFGAVDTFGRNSSGLSWDLHLHTGKNDRSSFGVVCAGVEVVGDCLSDVQARALPALVARTTRCVLVLLLA